MAKTVGLIFPKKADPKKANVSEPPKKADPKKANVSEPPKKADPKK